MTSTKEFTGPLYAIAGVGDLAVAKLKELPAEYHRLQGQVRDLDVDSIRSQVEDYSGRARDAYDELVTRGEKFLTSIRRQQGSQDLAEQVDETRRQARGTGSRAKRTAASARKTASTSRKAAGNAARKAG